MASALLAVAASCAPGTQPAAGPPAAAPQRIDARPVTLASLEQGRLEHGFVPVARYVDGEGRPRGARLSHAKTGFVLDYLAIETAPQAMVYATTYAFSDRGEPHTQEHLVLGRGNAGRALGNMEHANLVSSSAFTARTRTAYHFHTIAGPGAFWDLLPRELGALLHADYSDEEIRREVRDFGVATRPDGTLALEEKGTVYNEMVRSYEDPERIGWESLMRLAYGEGHPLASSNGGTPEGIRELTPALIRAFYAEHYRLDNMGMVVVLPRSALLDTALERIARTLDGFAPPGPPPSPLVREATLPPPRGAAPGTLRVERFPHVNADQPGSMQLAWPADRALPTEERVLLELFLEAFGGGEGSRLYRALIDPKTRRVDVGATAVGAGVGREPGQIVTVDLSNVRAASADEASLRRVRDLVTAELAAVVALPDGSKELAELGDRIQARIVAWRRGNDKMLDTPPRFGARGTYDGWVELLNDLQADPGFDKSLTRKAALARAEAVARSTVNPWRERIHAWKLDVVPYGVVSQPSKTLRQELDAARAARVAGELARLESAYGVSDPAEALTRRKAEIDRADREIFRAEASVPMPPLTADVPMTNDDLLQWRTETVFGVPVVASTFDTMKSVTVGLALRLDAVPEALLPYVAVLPSLVQDVGVIEGGAPIPYDQVRDHLRREVLGVRLSLSTSFATGRAELVLLASGNDLAEARRALSWAERFLLHADLRPENLARVKDVIDRKAVELGEVMSGPEEYWVESVSEAYRRQDSPLLAHAGSFLTRAHDAFRVSWRLEGGGAPFAHFLAALGSAGRGSTRADLSALARALASSSGKDGDPKVGSVPPALAGHVRAAKALGSADRARAAKVGRDLGRLLSDVPDVSLAAEWAALCKEIAVESGAAGSEVSGDADAPGAALRAIVQTLSFARHASQARAWIASSAEHHDALLPDLERLFGVVLDPSPVARVAFGARPHVVDRASARGAAPRDPAFVALVNPSTANGAIVSSARTADFDDPSDHALDVFLAANIPGGSGAHSYYKRIWGAGLAYSGNLHVDPRLGRSRIYGDRCASLPSFLKFVDGQIRGLRVDARLVEYAAARAFGSRVADTYEDRAWSIAVDLAEGYPPERIRRFRERVLAARRRPGIVEAVQAEVVPAFSALQPTLDASLPMPAGALQVLVGPEAQIAATEAAVRAARGPDVHVARLYPRDFWYVGG